MQVTETLSEGLRRAYAVTVPAAEIESKAETRLANLSKTLRLPGFRPGKVPLNLVRKRFGTSVLAEVMQAELDRAPGQVIEERGLRPAGQPRIALPEGVPGLESGTAADLAFTIELDVLPDIRVPELSEIALTRLSAAPEDAAIEASLAQVARGAATTEDVGDRGAAAGDRVVADFVGRSEGVAFPGGTGTDVPIDLGGNGFIPGFAEQLDGIRPGETRTIQVTFPAEYHAAELAGKPAEFEVTAKAVQRVVPAPLDDALGEKLGFGDLAELRDYVVQQSQRELDQLSRLRIKRDLLDALAAQSDFPAPQNLLEAEFNAIWQRVQAERAAGREDEEDRGKDEETLRAEYRAIAERRVRLGLLLSEIGRANNVQVTQQELNNALRAEVSRYPGQEAQVLEFFKKNPGAFEQLRGPIFEDKVVDHILGVAQVTERKVTREELVAAAADGGAGPLPEGAAAGGSGHGAAEPEGGAETD